MPERDGRQDTDIGAVGEARPNRQNLFERAYEKIEEQLVNCTLPPGRY